MLFTLSRFTPSVVGGPERRSDSGRTALGNVASEPCFSDRVAEDRRGLLRPADAVSFFADAPQHAELIFAVVNVAPAGIDKIRRDGAGDMQERRSTVP